MTLPNFACSLAYVRRVYIPNLSVLGDREHSRRSETWNEESCLVKVLGFRVFFKDCAVTGFIVIFKQTCSKKTLPNFHLYFSFILRSMILEASGGREGASKSGASKFFLKNCLLEAWNHHHSKPFKYCALIYVPHLISSALGSSPRRCTPRGGRWGTSATCSNWASYQVWHKNQSTTCDWLSMLVFLGQ